MAGFNWFLVIVAVVVAVLAVGVALYILIEYQHELDSNQAWWPKIVVVASIALAIFGVLLYPMDVINRGSCEEDITLSDCDLSLPMRTLWYIVYFCIVGLVVVIIPFTLFFYEGSFEQTWFQRFRAAILWTCASILVFGLILGITYFFLGYLEIDTQKVESGVYPWGRTLEGESFARPAMEACVEPARNPLLPLLDGRACDASEDPIQRRVWDTRASFPVFAIAIFTVLGWLLFMIAAGVGMVALPLDMIMRFWNRPKKTITKVEFLTRAKEIANRANTIKQTADGVKQEGRAGGGRANKKQTQELAKQLVLLEDDATLLSQLYPQDTNREATWMMFVLGFWASLFAGIVLALVGLAWIVHICLYVLPDPPVTGLLNDMFVELDDTFTLLGIVVFALFCLYLVLAAIKGFLKLGLNFGIISLYPMRHKGTLMSAFLVNCALILLSSTAILQFCASAFEVYANETIIQDIFGREVKNLRGIRYLYKYNVFVYVLLAMNFLTLLTTVICGPRKRSKAAAARNKT